MGLDVPSLKPIFLAKSALQSQIGKKKKSSPWQAVTLSGWQEIE